MGGLRAGCSELRVKLDYGADGRRLTYFLFCCWPLIGYFLPPLDFSFSESAVKCVCVGGGNEVTDQKRL